MAPEIENDVKKITVNELFGLLADPDVSESELQKYVAPDEEGSGPFAPRFRIDPETVAGMDTPEDRQRAAVFLSVFNSASRHRRHRRFREKIAEGDYHGPIIVSEGDSWFQYPIMLDDVIDVLMKDYAIWSLGAAGDTLENMIESKEYLKAIREFRPPVFLFSAGGNDMVGGGALENHLRDFDPALTPAQHLKESYDSLLGCMLQQYDKLFRSLEPFGVKIVCHGYDYAVPADGKWLGRPMARRGIEDAEFQKSIAKEMVDRFNKNMLDLTGSFPNVTFLDNRGTVAAGRWNDELHPADEGYADVAAAFKRAIEEAVRGGSSVRSAPSALDAARPRSLPQMPQTAERRPAAAKTAARRGVSLHIGINFVDKNHYAGWDGKLNACEYDAEDMENIASELGYSSTLLLSRDATRTAVVGAIEKAAEELRAGDIFFLTYSGHGGQTPDFNGDEADEIDETWCLYDGQLIDDELYMLWAKFREGVRVLVVSDSCHSGTVIKALPDGQFVEDTPVIDPELPATWPRCMPPQVAARVFRRNRQFYTDIGKSLEPIESAALSKELANPLDCTVQLLSGCQDNQYSMDGPFNGAFTARLLRVWADGRFKGNYDRFYKSIRRSMPSGQTPNRWVIGRENGVFVNQKPFRI